MALMLVIEIYSTYSVDPTLQEAKLAKQRGESSLVCHTCFCWSPVCVSSLAPSLVVAGCVSAACASAGAGSADVRKLSAVDVVGLDVFAVSVLLVEPMPKLADVSLDALEGFLAVDIGIFSLNASLLAEVVAFMLKTPLGVEAPKTYPVVVEDEGCTSVVEAVLGVCVSEAELSVLNSPPVVAEDEDSTVPDE